MLNLFSCCFPSIHLKPRLKNNFWFLILSALFFAAGIILIETETYTAEKIISDFEKSLHRKEIRLEEELDKICKNNYDVSYIHSLHENEGISFLIYDNDSLIFWTGRNILPKNYFSNSPEIKKHKTGWYETRIKKNNNKTCIGLLLIKNNFPYQNNYLNNYFNKGLRVIKKANLHELKSAEGIIVKNNQSQDFCRFEIVDDSPLVPYKKWGSYALFTIGIILLIQFFYNECESYSKTIGRTWPLIVYISTLITLRYLTIFLRFPESIYSTELFGPRYFADATSFWLPSLGDFLINSLLILYISYYLFKKIKNGNGFEKINSIIKTILTLLVFIVICVIAWNINTLFVGLIRNSNIPFNINNLFALTTQTYIGLSILGFIFLAFIFITHVLIKFIYWLKQPRLYVWILAFISFAIYTTWCHINGRLDLIAIMWAFPIIITMLVVQKNITESYPFSIAVVFLFWVSLYSVHTFLKHNGLKEYDLRFAYAEKLSSERDPVAEHLFAETEKDLLADTVLRNLFYKTPVAFDEIEKRLLQQHFSGYWERYNLSVSIFDSLCYPVLKSGINSVDNNFNIENTIDSKGEETTSEKLFYIPDPSGKINYVARLPIQKSANQTPFVTVYIDFKSGLASDEIGFPELLLDKSVAQNTELKNYSYAKYKNNELVTHFGKTAYPINSKLFETTANKTNIITTNNISYVILKKEEGSFIVISKEATTWLDEITTFSYLFAIYSLLLLIIISTRQLGNSTRLFKTISFKNKLQVLLIGVVLISLLLFGLGTIYFINKQFDDKSREIVSEKIHSVQIEVQNKLDGANERTINFKEYASYILKKFSNVFFTDITLYDNKGNLLATSSPKLFDEGLLPHKMNFTAYDEMIVKGQTEFIHNESIGKLNYLSAYMPFTDKRGRVLGYLNLPYFARQSQLEKEISAYLVTLINVYVLLFALTVLIAIFFGNYLTRPLRIIQDKMSKLTLGKPNELIEWNEKDEIGNLVSEYNRMISELSKSAEMLARSERELAWREMAKQVAHEIKNPLTPMKLSIQHLKKIWKDKSPDIDEKIDSVTKMLIEQIDTLSHIANEFSNFAKMPKANEEKINIKNILGNIVELYKDSASITLVDKCNDTNCTVMADKEQLLRVFNNLVKNAIQAIPEDRAGVVEIKISVKNNDVVVAIKDNGSGISETAMDKIFMPNFTTKTAGMGLGLAMVKNIVETSRGKIWFETTKDVGTTFYVSLPVVVD